MTVYPEITVIDEPRELYEIKDGFGNNASTKEVEQSRASAEMTTKSLSKVITG